MRPRQHSSLLIRYILVWVGILLTFLFTVFPELLVAHLGILAHLNLDVASKLFAGLNAILLTILAFVQEALRKGLRPPEVIGGLGKPLPHLDGKSVSVHSAPLDIVIIFGLFPSFHQDKLVEAFLRKAVILANFKPLLVQEESRLPALFTNRGVRGIIADRKFYERFILYTQHHHTPFFEIFNHTTCTIRGGGLRIRIGLAEHSLDQSALHHLARALVTHHGPDTPRGIGFHGNWAGTYGLMSLKQRDNLQVEGRYWYAGGTLVGHCEIDDLEERLVLQYSWRQHGSTFPSIGSSNFGKGVMVIPAGYDFLYGYWCPDEDQHASQSWCAARLCEDISHDILTGGPYSKDFGLHQHPRNELVSW